MKRTLFLALAAGVMIWGCSSGGSDEPKVGSKGNKPPSLGATGSTVAYSEVQTILTRSCVGCHGETNPKEKLNLTSYETLMKGSEHGPVLVAGDPDNSKIIHALKGQGMERMPFKAPALPEEEIAKFEAWIKAGAKNE